MFVRAFRRQKLAKHQGEKGWAIQCTFLPAELLRAFFSSGERKPLALHQPEVQGSVITPHLNPIFEGQPAERTLRGRERDGTMARVWKHIALVALVMLLVARLSVAGEPLVIIRFLARAGGRLLPAMV